MKAYSLPPLHQLTSYLESPTPRKFFPGFKPKSVFNIHPQVLVSGSDRGSSLALRSGKASLIDNYRVKMDLRNSQEQSRKGFLVGIPWSKGEGVMMGLGSQHCFAVCP